MKSMITVTTLAFVAFFLSACSEYNAGYYQPQPQGKRMQQVAKESVHLSAQDTANINKMTKK